MVFNLIASIFFNVQIYSFPNSGRLYDLGFVLGAAAFFNGSGSTVAAVKGRVAGYDRPRSTGTRT